MIHRIKTITWEVRSHRHKTVVDSDGICRGMFCTSILNCMTEIDKPVIKTTIWHLQEVLKLLNRIEKEKKARKENQDERNQD